LATPQPAGERGRRQANAFLLPAPTPLPGTRYIEHRPTTPYRYVLVEVGRHHANWKVDLHSLGPCTAEGELLEHWTFVHKVPNGLTLDERYFKQMVEVDRRRSLREGARMIHLRNGQAERHPHTRGEGKTWCGKKLLGQPEEAQEGVETFVSYGNRIDVSFDPERGTCARCREAFDAAYARAFPEGLKPIATFRLDDPDDMSRAKDLLSPEAMNRFFGPGGGGMSAFEAALQGESPEAAR